VLEAADLELADGRVVGVACADGTRLAAGTTVLAAGAWAGALGRAAGSRVELRATRRHLMVTAQTEDGVVMGLCHPSLPLEGVQFHPESFMTPSGPSLLANFLSPEFGWARIMRNMTWAAYAGRLNVFSIDIHRLGRCDSQVMIRSFYK